MIMFTKMVTQFLPVSDDKPFIEKIFTTLFIYVNVVVCFIVWSQNFYIKSAAQNNKPKPPVYPHHRYEKKISTVLLLLPDLIQEMEHKSIVFIPYDPSIGEVEAGNRQQDQTRDRVVCEEALPAAFLDPEAGGDRHHRLLDDHHWGLHWHVQGNSEHKILILL